MSEARTNEGEVVLELLRGQGFPYDHECVLKALVEKEEFPASLRTKQQLSSGDLEDLGKYLQTKIEFKEKGHVPLAILYCRQFLGMKQEPNHGFLTPEVGRGEGAGGDDDDDVKPPATRPDLEGEYRGSEGSKPIDVLRLELESIIAESKRRAIEDSQGNNTCQHGPAPILCMLQSTGYGKTRAMIELAKEKRVVYLLWKDIQDSWERPKVVRRVMQDFIDPETRKYYMYENTFARKWSMFLDAVKETADNYLTPKDLFDAQIKDGAFDAFYGELLQNWE
jgi:hypothetical protein